MKDKRLLHRVRNPYHKESIKKKAGAFKPKKPRWTCIICGVTIAEDFVTCVSCAHREANDECNSLDVRKLGQPYANS